MQIAWASTGPKNSKDFFKIFPRDGLAIVGRGSAKKADPGSSSVIFDATGSMLNEQLPLHHAKRIAVIAPSHVINSPQTAHFIGEAALHTRDEVISVEPESHLAAVTILGFGLKPLESTEKRFQEFCLQLLDAHHFEVLRNSETHVVGRFDLGGLAAFAFLPSQGSLDNLVTSLKKKRMKWRCILTNFTPGASLVRHCEAQNVSIFHYSLLNEFLSKHPKLRADRQTARRAE
jgi:hypothetical protein